MIKTNNEWEEPKGKEAEIYYGLIYRFTNENEADVRDMQKFFNMFRSLLSSERQKLRKEIEGYPHKCGACEEKISNLSHTMLCDFRKHLLKLL